MKIDSFTGGYEFMSNFYLHPVTYEGVLYNSNEVAYQAAKTLDPDERKLVRLAPIIQRGEIVGWKERTPGQSKKQGRKVTLRPDWEQIKIGVMEELVRQKFQYHTLKEMLLSTGNDELVEGNYWNDRFWGVCNGVGENHLGKILMKVRQELREKKV